MTETVLPVLLCGGSGRRLWPLSREAFPKPFLDLGLGKSLIRQSLERARLLNDQVLCVAGEPHRFYAAAAMHDEGCEGRILLEPMPRDTAGAVAVAAIDTARDNADAVLVIMPTDSYVEDAEAFDGVLSQAVKLAARTDTIVLVGIRADTPSTAYGYIEPDTPFGDEPTDRKVRSFYEKPDPETAISFVERGFLWNAGVFVGRARTFVDAFQAHAPDVFDPAQRAVAGAVDDGQFRRLEESAYSEVPAIQVDTALIEKSPNLAVVPFTGTWNDMGSWAAVADILPGDAQANRILGDVIAEESRRNLVVSGNRLAVILGVDDIVVVDTPDALLVAARSEATSVKNVAANLAAASRAEALIPTLVQRFWGSYEVLAARANYQMKELRVKPGASLSPQYHRHRSKHWVVTEGEAEVTCGDRVFTLHENESTFIPQGAVHRLHNPTDATLIMFEVQHGAYLGEDNTVRMWELYDRAEAPRSAQ